MVFIFVKETLCTIVEQMNAAVVEGCEDPGSVLMEGQAFHTLALRLELSLHHLLSFLIITSTSFLLCKFI